MKITAVDTLRLQAFPNLIWVEIQTDAGIAGLGETFMGAGAVEAQIHDWCAPKLLGQDPTRIPALKTAMTDYLGWRGAGAETRAVSAIDIALWDLWGKACERPVAEMLGGRARDQIRVYNTCAGYEYVRGAEAQAVDNWGVGATAGPYEDLQGFLTDAGALAQSLLDQGVTAMKIWPFDIAAERSGGWDITAAELRTALEPFERIRAAVGDAMDIMVEFHGLWSLPMAKRLARAVAPYAPYWLEDPFRLDVIGDLTDYAPHTDAWICVSETLPSAPAFREALETGTVGVAMLDLSWCGGLTEARKIAGLAEAWKVPVAPHDCTGPVVFAASCHFSMHAPNALIQESVRAFYTGWHREIVDGLPTPENGQVSVSDTPGLGVALKAGLRDRPDAIRRRSAA